jgi:uncharacterized protein (TIGR02246 family)
MPTSVEDRLARLEAIEDIKALKARYCALCDADYDPEGLAALFVQDGIWDGGETFGRHEGRDAIRAFFNGVSGTITFAAHLVLNPIIDVRGPDTAMGKWRLIMPCTVAREDGSPEARWLLSAYDETYARVDGRWLFKTLTVTTNFYAPHLTGWA